MRDEDVVHAPSAQPDAPGLGDHTESGRLAVVEYVDEDVDEDEARPYSLPMYVDNSPAIAGGREVCA